MDSLTLGFVTQESSIDFLPLDRKQCHSQKTLDLQCGRYKAKRLSQGSSVFSFKYFDDVIMWEPLPASSVLVPAASRAPDPDYMRTLLFVYLSKYHNNDTQGFFLSSFPHQLSLVSV